MKQMFPTAVYRQGAVITQSSVLPDYARYSHPIMKKAASRSEERRVGKENVEACD